MMVDKEKRCYMAKIGVESTIGVCLRLLRICVQHYCDIVCLVTKLNTK